MRPPHRFAGSISLLLAACTTQPAPPPAAPIAAASPAQTAVVVAARPLAAPADRTAVLISLTGTSSPPTDVPQAAELIVQTPDGRTLTCIARAHPAPRVGATVILTRSPACARREIAAAPAIR